MLTGSMMIDVELEKLLGSPVYNLRHLVAAACVAMVPIQNISKVTETVLRSLVLQQQEMSSNMLHGKLIFLEMLLHNQMLRSVFFAIHRILYINSFCFLFLYLQCINNSNYIRDHNFLFIYPGYFVWIHPSRNLESTFSFPRGSPLVKLFYIHFTHVLLVCTVYT